MRAMLGGRPVTSPLHDVFEPWMEHSVLTDTAPSESARASLHQAIRTVEDYRNAYPQHAASSIVFAASIIPTITTPGRTGNVYAIALVPRATMRRTRRSAPSRLRRAWSVLRGR
jgi:hypothetical protein